MSLTTPRTTVITRAKKREDKRERVTERFPDKASIATLTQDEISRMTCAELVRVIRGAGMPLMRTEIDKRLDCFDRTTLERLAYLARRCCRNQGY